MSLLASARFALQGLAYALRHERNLQVQAGIAAVTVALGLWTGLDLRDWALLALAAGAVLSAELMNTGLEELADALRPKRDARVGRAKDIAAAAVLVAALFALGVGLLVFWPHWRHA
jgi:diacylglycerol kinase (ATP)